MQKPVLSHSVEIKYFIKPLNQIDQKILNFKINFFYYRVFINDNAWCRISSGPFKSKHTFIGYNL